MLMLPHDRSHVKGDDEQVEPATVSDVLSSTLRRPAMPEFTRYSRTEPGIPKQFSGRCTILWQPLKHSSNKLEK